MPLPRPDWLRHFERLSTPADADGLDRRTFLQGALASSALLAAPLGLSSLAGRPAQPLGSNDRILVIVLMGGGNDGFSMVIPAEDGRYQDARRGLAISPGDAINFAPGLYWNQNLTGISSRYDSGDVAVVQGVGDPADDRSHFSSMARWMRGYSDSGSAGFTGWVGRWLDGAGLANLGAISIGNSGIPLHLRGNSSKVTALPTSPNLYGATTDPWQLPSYTALRSIRNSAPQSPWFGSVATAVADAVDAAGTVAPAYAPDLPEESIERDLALAAETINLDIGARIVSVSFGDFDTHDDHPARHQALMASFDAAVTGFFARLNPVLADRVTLMTFSEFGRSWTANDSVGIDHGTTSSALVIGNNVRGGLYGQAPDLSVFDDQGDLESQVDFRSYYASILEGWLGADSQQILGANYEDLGLFAGDVAGTCQGVPATLMALGDGGVLNGTPGRDVILGGPGDDVIFGLGGDDLICAGEGADVIWGGAGNDEIIAGSGADTLYGEDGNDVLSGQGGPDVARGGPGNDIITGGDDADRLLGGIGDDNIRGGPGDDYIGGFGGDDTLQGDGGNETIFGGFGSDTIEGNAGDDTIRGLVGDDTIRGGAGNDKLDGDRGNDRIDGGDGNDKIGGGNANDVLNGDAGNDELGGGQADDVISGGTGTDKCSGNLHFSGDTTDGSCETEHGFP